MTYNKLPWRRHRRRGTAAVELGLLLPLLVFLFVIAVDYSRIFYFCMTLDQCARNGALYASDPVVSPMSPYKSISEAALADASNISPAPTVTSANGTDADGNPYVSVTVAYQFKTITNYVGIPTQVNLTRTVQMRVTPSGPQSN